MLTVFCIANQPQLIHSSSQQSIAASDDYYSFSDISQASNHSKVTVVRYATPPTRRPSPSPKMPSRNVPDDATGPDNSSAVTHDPEQTSKRNPAAPNESSRMTENGTPSPGVDDMPYIRFAIDQLTRDEELLGEGRHGSVVSTEYPVERIIPDEGLGYYTSVTPQSVDQPNKEPQILDRPDSPGNVRQYPRSRQALDILTEPHSFKYPKPSNASFRSLPIPTA